MSLHHLPLPGGVPDMANISLVGGLLSSAASSVDAAGRSLCYISDTGTLMPDFAVASLMTQTFTKYLEVGGYAWRVVSEETINTYWEQFKKRYYWEEGLYDAIYNKWAWKAAKQYNDFVHTQKMKRHGTGRPNFIPEAVWASWCAYWDTEAASELSQKAKKNRLSQPNSEGTGQIRHRGGSRSAAAQAIPLAEESGGDVGSNLYSTFWRFHYEDGEYTDVKSRRIGEEIERRIALASQPLPDGTQPPPVDVNEIYLEVTSGPSKKNRTFEIGSLYKASHVSSPAGLPHIYSTSSASSRHQQDQLRAQLEVERVLEAERVEMGAWLETRLQEQEEKIREEMKAQMVVMMDFLRGTQKPRPSS